MLRYVNILGEKGEVRVSMESIIHKSLFFITFVIFAGKSKEAERKRINKELANIRSKFKGNFVSIHTYIS